MNKGKRYSPEVRERAVRLVFDLQKEDQSQWSAMQSISQKLGCTETCGAELTSPLGAMQFDAALGSFVGNATT